MNIFLTPPGKPAATQGPGGMNRAGWHLRANAPAVFWLVALVVVVLIHRNVPDSGWLMVHLLFLGAVTNSILVWSWHFAQALLRGPTPDSRGMAARLVLLNVAVLAVVVSMVADIWLLTLLGSILVGAVVAAHAVVLGLRARRALPSRFGATVWYYVAACLLLPVGAGVGAALAANVAGEAHTRLLLVHLSVNVLGFVGLTVMGTLMTLLPTMLRTRVADGADQVARHGAFPLLAGVLLTAAGAAAGVMFLCTVGLLAYLGGVVYVCIPLAKAVRGKPPVNFAPLSAIAAIVWLAVSLTRLAGLTATAGSWTALHQGIESVAPVLAAGFAAQVLGAALSYLLPVVLGGGPARVRQRTAILDKAAVFRVVLVNVALVASLLPVPSLVRVGTTFLVLAGLAWFLPLLGVALLAKPLESSTPGARPAAPAAGAGAPSPRAAWNPAPGRRWGMAAAGLAVVVLVVVAGIVADPSSLPGPSQAGTQAAVHATGQTTTVEMTMKDMRFHPSTVDVPAGNRLVIHVTNVDSMVHDLVTAGGAESGRLYPGEKATVDAGVIAANLDGWCSIVGHRQQGMVFRIVATGAAPAATAMPGMDHGASGGTSGTAPGAASPGAASLLDFMKQPAAGFKAHNAVIPPLPAGTVHNVALKVTDQLTEVAAGVKQTLWTYNGTAPGPTLRGKVGDKFNVTLTNDATMGHSIDFHAGSLAPDQPMRTVNPGESLTYTFTATRAGIWMYHCSTMPMSEHIANGMFGAVIIDPPKLPPVDKEYVLIQSELYLGPQDGVADLAKIQADKPDAVVFNGYANQYGFRPLTAKVGEKVRIWVLDAGPNRATSFHVVGGQFSTVWSEGRYLLDGSDPTAGSQALALAPAQGGFVDLTFPQAGSYPFVSHYMVDAERGARGVFKVAG
ncbi:multicopper oxidase domain-containing protein [Arthrobacter sp. STN4]|uniref:multicopper oxidase domain-containing protein n=1 Tax=Arthrobacter sp. STN4 TaxID=2923276 RepID=UPI00211A60CA|nr:multicopper oxidase domain-containing protein [Arthrobacter sp. STN4]MCQ9162676.1 multicopper oxidase domain-containing protein [Arthrobacter sp. STN4]